MLPMEGIRKLSKSYKEIQEAKFDVSKIIKDLGDDFSGSNEDQMRGVQLIKGLALSDDPKANEFMEKLDAATSQISQEMSEGLHAYDKKKKKIKEASLPRQLKDPKKEILVVKDGEVEVIDKKDWPKYKKKGYLQAEEVEESKTLIDLLNSIKSGGKIEDIDLTEEEITSILNFYENTLDSTGQNEFNTMSITKIQSTMKKLGL